MCPVELADALLQNLRALHKAKPHKNISAALHGETFVLNYILLHGDVLPGEISNEMDVSSARVAAALNSLENKGLITRQIDKCDRRKVLVRVTKQGKEEAEKHYRTATQAAAKILSLLGEHDAKEYVRITGKLAQIVPECEE